jgi:dihydrofolate reductase
MRWVGVITALKKIDKGATIMRKVIMINRISMDGFFAGPNGEMDWFIHDPEVDSAVHGKEQGDVLIFGSTTYREFDSFWPHIASDPNASKEFRALADELTQMTKVVFSTTLKENDLTWKNTKLFDGNLAEVVRNLKNEDGTDILIFGSGTIVQQLASEGLIDEYMFVVTPIVLGTGKPLFKDVHKFNLKLLRTMSFNSGNVLLHYAI